MALTQDVPVREYCVRDNLDWFVGRGDANRRLAPNSSSSSLSLDYSAAVTCPSESFFLLFPLVNVDIHVDDVSLSPFAASTSCGHLTGMPGK